MQAHFCVLFACDGCVWYTNRILVNPSSGGSYRYEEFLPTCSCQDLSWPCHRGGVAFSSWRTVQNVWPELWGYRVLNVLGAIASTWPTWLPSSCLIWWRVSPTPMSAPHTTLNLHHKKIHGIIIWTSKPAQYPVEGPRPSRETFAALLCWHGPYM